MDKEKLLELYKPYTTVLGPYIRKDGRQHVVLNNSEARRGDKNKTKTISYPKAKYESITGHKLKENETIDHDDRDFENNSFDNLKPMDRAEHAARDAVRVLYLPINCPVCNKSFTPTKDQVSTNSAGPFCSKKCVGLYGAEVQNGKNKIVKTAIQRDFYQLDKS